jgi:parallel beta-helix repeat protein
VIGHNSRVRLNATHGNGYSEPPDDFGIGLQGGATGNVIEENTATANTNGIYIAAAAGENLIRNNVAIGNPAIQTSVTAPAVRAVDILNLSPAGRITFERNVCVTSVNAPCPTSVRPPQ